MRSSGHKNSDVRSNVMKLLGVRVAIDDAEKGHLQIISQERGGGDKLEANITYTLVDRRYVT